MGGIILSRKKTGLFFETSPGGWKIYSMEELCYYLKHNIYEVIPEFFSEKLFLFLREMEMEKLAVKLSLDKAAGKHSVFLALDVIFAVDYYSKDEKREIEQSFLQITKRTPAENKKVRADILMEQGKLLEAYREYRSLLGENSGATEENCADAWNNIGVIYARRFQYDRALKCFERAMDLTGQQEYLDNIICALIMACKGFNSPPQAWCLERKKACMMKYQIAPEIFEKYEEVILREEKNIRISQETIEFKEQFSIVGQGDITKVYNSANDIITGWKLEYKQQERERQSE